jgi:hypothetical protein
MKVRCLYSNYGEVPSLDSENYRYTSNLHLKKNKEYIIYGLAALKRDGKILYLIVDETNYPDFYIADLFEIIDSQLAATNWYFGIGSENHAVSYIIGYEEFVKNRDHFESIILHDDETMPVFRKWLEFVDKQYFNPDDIWEKITADVDGVEIGFIRNRYTGELKEFKFI